MPASHSADYLPWVMDAPANLGPGGATEHRIRTVYSDVIRAISRNREQDPALTDAQIVEALRRLLVKYGGD